MPEKIPPLPPTPIGVGNEKRVFVHPNNPEKVVAEYRSELTPREIKSVFYLAKLINLLFPGNYVHLSQAGNEKETGKSKFIAERVHLDPDSQRLADYSVADETYLMGEGPSLFTEDELADLGEFEQMVMGKSLIKELATAMRHSGIAVDIFNSENFTLSSDSVRYIDVIKPFTVSENGKAELRLNLDKLNMAISEIKDDYTREKASLYLDRILKLSGESAQDIV